MYYLVLAGVGPIPHEYKIRVKASLKNRIVENSTKVQIHNETHN